MKRRGPKTGYDFDAKTEYRENVWKTFADNLPNVESAKVAFLPSKEGLEIPVALKYGFKEENLIAIDENPALIASAKWRREYPKIKCYGSNVSRAFERMAKDGITIDAANLDFCNNLSEELLKNTESFIEHDCVKKNFYLFITMLEGRESRFINFIADVISSENSDDTISKRSVFITEYIRKKITGDCNVVFFDTYKSSTQKMSYTGIKIIQPEKERCMICGDVACDEKYNLSIKTKYGFRIVSDYVVSGLCKRDFGYASGHIGIKKTNIYDFAKKTEIEKTLKNKYVQNYIFVDELIDELDGLRQGECKSDCKNCVNEEICKTMEKIYNTYYDLREYVVKYISVNMLPGKGKELFDTWKEKRLQTEKRKHG